MCGGLHDRSIQVWNRATLELEQTLTGTLDQSGRWCQLRDGSSAARQTVTYLEDQGVGRCNGALQRGAGYWQGELSGGERESTGEWELRQDGQGVEDSGGCVIVAV